MVASVPNFAADRLTAAIEAGRAALASPQSGNDAFLAGELRYLLGRALGLTRARPEAVQILADLVEALPKHDRADAAARLAVNLAAEEVRRGGHSGSPASRAIFIRAARVLRQRIPAEVSAAELTFSIGVALENDGRYEQAAGEYATVPIDHARWNDAALGRVRCWREALEQATAGAGRPTSRPSEMIAQAQAAARAVREQAGIEPTAAHRPASRTADCSHARLILAVAELLNHPGLEASQEAAGLLEDFEKRFVGCPDLQGSAMWQRIVSLRQLKRLQEAQSVLDRYLTTDPDHAGPTIVGLLKAVHDEMQVALRRG